MKYLKQFFIILMISFLGELLKYILPLPVPASIYGLLLMFTALCTKIIPLEQVDSAAGFFITIMPPMFIPAAVGLLVSWDALKEIWIPVIFITFVTTVLVMAATGRISQFIIKRQERMHSHNEKPFK